MRHDWSFTSSERDLRPEVLGLVGGYADGIRLSRLARLAQLCSWAACLKGCPSFGRLDAGRKHGYRRIESPSSTPHNFSRDTVEGSPRYLGMDTYLNSVLTGVNLLGYPANSDCIQDRRRHYFNTLYTQIANTDNLYSFNFTPNQPKPNCNHSAAHHPLTMSRIAKREILSVALAAAILLFILRDVCRDTWTWIHVWLNVDPNGSA
ncbi:hypothetical protein DL767_005738 [Monosporascus sp. MG133]|nr:hypothetical protein DL767_005738 [Monosporascus sp. MG133]